MVTKACKQQSLLTPFVPILSPVVGVIGVTMVSAKTIYDIARKTFTSQTAHQTTIQEDIQALKTFVYWSVPLIGVPLSKHFARPNHLNQKIFDIIDIGCTYLLLPAAAAVVGLIVVLACSILGTTGFTLTLPYTVALVAKKAFLQFAPFNQEEWQQNLKKEEIKDLTHKISGAVATIKSCALLTLPLVGIPLALLCSPIGTTVGFIASQGMENSRFIRDKLLYFPTFPLRGCSMKKYRDRIGAGSDLIRNHQTHTLKTKDGRTIDARHIVNNKQKTSPTVILFHGNACTLEAMKHEETFYQSQGFNTLSITLGGYPATKQATTRLTTEKTAYFDALAAVTFLNNEGVPKEKIVAHGYSIGGTLASFLGRSGLVQHVVLDRTLSTPLDVARNTVTNFLSIQSNEHEDLAKPKKKKDFLQKKIHNQAMDTLSYFETTLNSRLKKQSIEVSGKEISLDYLNNETKVAQFPEGTGLTLIEADKDSLMKGSLSCSNKLKTSYDTTHPDTPATHLTIKHGGHETSIYKSCDRNSDCFGVAPSNCYSEILEGLANSLKSLKSAPYKSAYR